MRVVVADDNVVFRDVYRGFLRGHHEIVGIADNGEQAVQIVREQQPDLVILDVSMPRMTGLQAARAIRGEGFRGTMMLATNIGNDELVSEMAELRLSRLVKPFSRAPVLLAAIEKAVNGNAV